MFTPITFMEILIANLAWIGPGLLITILAEKFLQPRTKKRSYIVIAMYLYIVVFGAIHTYYMSSGVVYSGGFVFLTITNLIASIVSLISKLFKNDMRETYRNVRNVFLVISCIVITAGWTNQIF